MIPDKSEFSRLANAGIESIQSTYAERGGDYGDTWDLANVSTVFLDATLRALHMRPVTRRQARLLTLAALIDVKMSRVRGKFKADTFIDLGAYNAAYLTAISEYLEGENAKKEALERSLGSQSTKTLECDPFGLLGQGNGHYEPCGPGSGEMGSE